jgi:hypothetical protein
VREEARVGQRTTPDVLNAQQDLVNARVALVTAQRDRVVASYTVLAASGALSPQILGLKIEVYDPVVHYQQVRGWRAHARWPLMRNAGRDSVLGDTVNVASRLEARIPIVTGAGTEHHAKEKFATMEIDRSRVKGTTEPETVFTVRLRRARSRIQFPAIAR